MIKAANQADATAKSFRTVGNSSEYREVATKAAEANERMTTTTQKVVNAQQEQSKSLAEVKRLVETATKAAQEQTGTLNQNINSQIRLKAELDAVNKELKDAQKGYVDTGADVGQLTKRQLELRQAINENNRTLRNQIKEVNASDGSINQLRSQLNLLNQTYDDLQANDRNGIVGKEMLAGIDALSNKLKELEGATGRFQRNVGNYPETFGEVGQSVQGAFSEFKSGNIQGGIDGTKAAMNGLVASARAFIASPIGIAVAALAAIGLAAKGIWDYNQGLKENLVLTEQFTGATGQSADAIRQQAQAMTDTFGGDFQENLNAAQKLVKAFGLTYEEAFDEIAQGLANGGKSNKEFFDSINEYPQLFAKAGYSASEFIGLVNTGFEEGLFSDKLVDGIKEADLALKEQTKTTRDALVNAFGDVWSDDLLRRIKVGETTTKDALIEISAQAQKTGLNQQQLYQLTADVFKGAGEDAGGAAKYFDILNKSVDNLEKPLTKTSQYFLDLRDANLELEQAMDSALKSDSVISFSQQWDIAWVKIQTGFFEIVKGARDLVSWYDKMTVTSESLSKSWSSLSKISDELNSLFNYLSITFERMGKIIGLSDTQASEFTKTMSYLTNPIKQAELVLSGLAQTIEYVANGIMITTDYAEGFGRTLGQLASFNFDNVKGLGENVDDIRAENNAIRESIELRKQSAEGFKVLAEIGEKVGSQAKSRIESEKEAEREAAAAAKKKAEEDAKRQKEYAAAQKKAQEDAKKRLADQQREELAMSSALLENFKIVNDKKLEFNESFTLQSIFDQQKYLNALFDMEKKHAEKVAGLTYEEALGIDVDKRTSEQQNLINKIIGLEKQKASEIKKINDDLATYMAKRATENFENEKKRLALDYAYNLMTIENTKDKVNKQKEIEYNYQKSLRDLEVERLELLAKTSSEEVEQKYNTNQILTDAEISLLDKVFEIRKADKERTDELKEAEKEKEMKGYEDSLEMIGEYLGAEQEMREVFEAFKKLQKAQDLNDVKATEEGKLEVVAAVANAASSIMGEQSAFGKALAMTAAAINTYLGITRALVEPGGVAGVALAAVIGVLGAVQIAKIATQKPPEAPRFSASFSTGVMNSSFEGRALVDEEGAELHYDRYGRLKSSGQSRPNIRDVKKGDTIFPADISKKIKEISAFNPMPDFLNGFNLRAANGNDYKFERLEGKLDGLKRAIKSKDAFVFDGKNIIQVSGSSGSTHQRPLPKFIDKPRQNTLR